MKRQCDEDSLLQNKKKKLKYLSENKLSEISSIFLNDKKHVNILIDVLDQFHKPTETPPACVSAVESIFTEVLRRRDMTLHGLENISEAERQYKEWLYDCYESAWDKLSSCLQKGTQDCKIQALNSLFKLLSVEAKFPVVLGNKKKKAKNNFPVRRLQEIFKSLYLSSSVSEEILQRMSEYLNYKDIMHNSWLAVEGLLLDECKDQPTDKSIWNTLLVLSKLPKSRKVPDIVFCDVKNTVPEERVVKNAVGNVWKHLAPWKYTTKTQQLLLIILVEHMMPQMDNVIFLTDYFMDALYREESEISMLALQGIFNLVLKHNIEYPNIYGKLYQLYTKEAFGAKYKTRLFVLGDEFLKSTHLPLALVAAFAKRFSRLLLVASPPDCVVLMTCIANLLIRHPDLKFLCHNPDGKEVEDDPFLDDEKDPVKSRAMQSQLWEVKLMQNYHLDRVSKLATFINNDLPSVEHDLERVLDLRWHKMVRKEVKILPKKIIKVAEQFQDKPLSTKMEEARQKELKSLFSDCSELFSAF